MKTSKSLLFVLAGVIIGINAWSQKGSTQPPDYSSYPYWIEMMQDHSVNFFEVQKAFNAYWENREITKGNGWKPFKRWEWWQGQHINPDGTRQEPDHIYKEYLKYMASHPDVIKSEADWTNLGPFAVPSKGYEGLGRINAIAFHPTNPDILFIGAPAGGCWKFDASSGQWTSATDDLPTLGVSSIIVNWSDPDNILIGTGDRDAGDAAGMGVFRSTDGGLTWEIWNSGMGNTTVGRLLQHPANAGIIYAASGSGIYKTTNSGANWTQIKTGGFKDIVFKPGNTDVLYAGGNGNFFRSQDAGTTWQQITNGIPGGSRSVIAVTPDDPEYVYCLLSNGDSYKGIYRSTNGGTSFTEMSTTPNIMSWGCNGGDGGQAWYDLDVLADPEDKDIVYAGGVNCFKSVDGGITWDISSHWWGDCGVPAVHADLHVLEYNPINNRIYAGNDGGIYYTANDGTSWPEITSGLPISQVYRIGQAKTDINKVINGYQDNGTSTYMGTPYWQTTNGGDGMECAFDHETPSYSYSTIYYGDIYRHFNNSGGVHVAGNGVHGMTESGGWITPFCLHEGDADIMFGGYKNVWRAEGIKTNTFTWKKLTTEGSSDIYVVEHSPANYDLFYYSRSGQLYRSDNVMSESPEWITLTSYLPGSGDVHEVEAHPFDENIVVITRGTKVYQSDNKGYAWTDISGTLPAINMNSIAFYLNSIDGMYVGSDAGVYYRDASMSDWVMYSAGLPVDASINEVEIYHNPANPAEDVIRAGTYGRGLWSSPMWHNIPVAGFEASETEVTVGCGIDFSDLSTGVPTSWSWTFEGGTPATSSLKNPEDVVYMTEGVFDVSLTVNNSEGTDTETIEGYIIVSASAGPIVNFTVSDSITCSGVSIQFTDLSANCPTGWTWVFDPSTISFTNGTNQTSQNPEVIFNASGNYTVSLTVSNAAGSNTLTKDDYIHIGGISLPFSDDFESGNLEAKSWTIENPDFDITWDVATINGNLPGDKAARLNFYDYVVPPGPRDRLITPVLSFGGLNQVYMAFKHAYAKRHTSVTDSLIVYISNDCGENWTRLFEAGEDGTGIFATHELMTTPFVPQTEEDWCGYGWGADCIFLDLSAWAGQENIQVAFETYNYFGNNLYIDNVSIGLLTDIQIDYSKSEIMIFPNPAEGMVNIYIPENHANVTVTVFAADGTLVYQSQTGTGLHTADLSACRKGIYFVRVQSEQVNEVRKLILK
jgi:PKD repeat protein